MITSKNDYHAFLQQDAMALGQRRTRPKLFGDDIWKFERCLRRREYYLSLSRNKKVLFLLPLIANHLRFRKLSFKLGFSIPARVFEEGLSIAHYGTIVVHPHAKVGKNCRLHEGVNIGATNGSERAPVIGNNVFIGTGAKIIGDITIADDVAIGANAVVVRSITEAGTTWGGVPARKLSDNDSHSNLSKLLF
ncbi:MAG: serine acetyltransferase [Ruminococcaceae bacterium]|nr:serine acetyltransferase [Oscillospiraceae bacterium]